MTQAKIEGKFYPLKHEEFIYLSRKLTSSEFSVYLWLKTNDPFGDKLVEADTKAIAVDLNISRRSVQRALVKLAQEKLIDLVITKIHYRVRSIPTSDTHVAEVSPMSPSDTHVAGVSPVSPERHQCRPSDTSVAQVTPLSPSSPETIAEQASQLSKTIKTIQTIHTSQTGEGEERQEITNVVDKDASTEELLAQEINQNPSFGKEKSSFGKENNSGGRSIFVTESNQEKKPAALGSREWGAGRMYTQTSPLPPAPFSPASSWRWLPDGPWNIDGKLDRNFQEWLAKKWVAKYGDDIYEAKANVLSYFRNDPAKLPIKWEQYHSEFQARFENIDTRLKNGITVSPEQRLNAIANARAVLPLSEGQQQTTKQPPVIHQPIPQLKPSTPNIEEQQPVLQGEITDPWEQAAAAEAEVAEAATTKANEKVETYVTDEEGRRYKDVTGIAARQSKEISAEERKTVAAQLSEFVSNLSQKMKIKSQPQPAEPKNELESLNEMLLDPVFRKDSEILGQVKRYLCNGYLADYDDAGYPISVYAF